MLAPDTLEMPPYLCRRHGRFFFRRAVPLDLRSQLRLTELFFSLGDSALPAARHIACHLFLLSESLFMSLRSLSLSPAATDGLSTDLLDAFRGRLEIELAAITPKTNFEPLDAPANRAARLNGLAAAAAVMAGTNDLDALALAIAPRLGAPADAEPAQTAAVRIIAQKFLRDVPEIARAAAAHFANMAEFRPAVATPILRGEQLIDAEPGLIAGLHQPGGKLDAKLQTELACLLAAAPPAGASTLAACAPATSIPATSIPATSALETKSASSEIIATAGLRPGERAAPVSALWGDFCDFKVFKKEWAREEALKSGGTLRLLISTLGDRQIDAYNRAGLATLLQVARQLPPDYSVRKDFRIIFEEQGVAALIETLKGQVYETMSPLTWNKHLGRIRSFFAWASGPGMAVVGAAEHLCDGLFIDVPKKPPRLRRRRAEQRIWLFAEIEICFNAPKFLGCAGIHHWKVVGQLIFRDHRYWLLIAIALHGCRREELTLLKVRHVRCDFGIWYFDLMDDEVAPQLKAEGSPREIPLHAWLIELGFLEARVRGRDPDALLFPDAVSTAAIDKNAEPFGKWFAELKRFLGLTRKMLDIHAFRSAVCTGLIDTGVPRAFIQELLGWEGEHRRSELDTYDKKDRLQLLKAAIDKWQPPIPVAAMIAAVKQSDTIDRTACWPDLVEAERRRADLKGRGGK